MKVLLATNRPDLLGGVESMVRDLAIAFGRRGQSAAVFTNGAYDGSRRHLESDGVIVVRDLDRLPFQPDIIHGHFSIDTMAAVTWLRDVPAVFHCHGAGYMGAPPRHPRIYRYAAITPSVAQRVIIESNFAESAVDVVSTGVDLHRFKTRRSPPERIRRALFYGNYHGPESKALAEVRRACAQGGIELDCIGRRLGRRIENPEEVLPEYDLVFAAGRSASEAIACGCAVITLGMFACGELVRTTSLDRLLRSNFTVGLNAPPPVAARIRSEIDRYEPADCAALTEQLRRKVDFERTADALQSVYAKAIAMHRETVPDPVAEHLAVARYLRKIVPLINLLDESQAASGPTPVRAGAAWQAASEALRRVYE